MDKATCATVLYGTLSSEQSVERQVQAENRLVVVHCDHACRGEVNRAVLANFRTNAASHTPTDISIILLPTSPKLIRTGLREIGL